MGKGRDRRRGQRRVRREHDQHGEAASRDRTIADVVLTAAERARTLGRFRSLRGRGGVVISFFAHAAILPACDPAELHKRTSGAIIEGLVDEVKWS